MKFKGDIMKKIILFCILTILTIALLLINGCKSEEEDLTPPSLPEETPIEPTAPIETLTDLEMISQAITLARDAILHINGLIVAYPDCDKFTIAPGESVFCSDISGVLAIRQGAKNRIQISMKSQRSTSIVSC